MEPAGAGAGRDGWRPPSPSWCSPVPGPPAGGRGVSAGGGLTGVGGKPAVLLQGALPAWQSMGLEEVALAVKSSGTITWLPEAGTTLEQGDVVAKVKETPVILLYGDLPGYRTLQDGSQGAHAHQLQADPAALRSPH